MTPGGVQLDAPILDLLRHLSAEDFAERFEANRRTLSALTAAIQLESDCDWLTAHQTLLDGCEQAMAQGDGTVRSALRHAFVDPERIAEVARLIERRYRVVESAFNREAPKPLLTDRHGRVLCDQGDGKLTVDPAVVAHDPAEQDRRFARARPLDRRYDVPGGREAFDFEDRVSLEAGVDIVRTLEAQFDVDGKRRRAEQTAATVARQLDAAIEAAGRDRQELKLLDQQLARIEAGAAEGISVAAARRKAAARADATLAEPVKLLDQLERKGKKAKKATGRLLQLDQAPGPDADALLRQRILPESRQLDQMVRAHMKEQGLPDSEYQVTLEAMLYGGGAR